jgi:hypothetical protein
MQEDDQRRTESAGALKGLFSWILPEEDEVVFEQISVCDPLSQRRATAAAVLSEIFATECTSWGDYLQLAEKVSCGEIERPLRQPSRGATCLAPTVQARILSFR